MSSFAVDPDMPLSPLAPADIPEVMRIERLPGYDAFVGRFEHAEHAALMAAADARYFGVRQGDGLAGFVILTQLGEPQALVRRIAVAEPERGLGARLLRGAVDYAFETTPAEAVILDVAIGNPRARHVYEREGFVEYGADEVHHLMSVSRERWAALRPGAGNTLTA